MYVMFSLRDFLWW